MSRLALIAATAFTLAAGAAFAQTSGGSSGVTSGPANGTPTTMGSGGNAPATPHQTDSLQNHGGQTVRRETQGGKPGMQSTVKPGLSDAGAGVHNGQSAQKP